MWRVMAAVRPLLLAGTAYSFWLRPHCSTAEDVVPKAEQRKSTMREVRLPD